MVDRRLELGLLREHLVGVAEQGASGHAILLVGESGVGKSRLVAEALAIATGLEMEVISAQCVGRGAEPLLPLREGLAAHLGRSPERIRRMLVGAGPSLLQSVPFVGAFLGALGQAWAERQFEGAGLHGVYEELARVLLGFSDKRGLCLAVEDLHAADRDTLYFLHYFLRKVRTRRVVVILSAQEEQLPDVPELADLVAQWTADGYAVQTVLPLERAHVGEYVHQAAAEGRPVDDSLVEGLFRLTGGNPFLLKETLRLLAEGQGAGPLAPLDEQLRVPARAEAVLQRRLSRAGTATREFLEAAAVVLETSQELAPIVFVLDVDEDAALRALAEACELRLMQEGPHGEVSFTHDLMHRAVYGEIGANARHHLHRRAGEWFEQAGRYASASFHYERAGRTGDTVRTALEAASRAERAGMYHSALAHYQRVRPLVGIEELGPRLGRALVILGDWEAAEQLVEVLPPDDGRVRLLRSELRFVRGDFQGAAEEARQALDAESVDRVDVLIRLADIALYLGDFVDAERHGQEALALAGSAGSAGSVSKRARCLGILGATAFFGGDLDLGQARFTTALELVQAQPEDERDRTIHTTLLGNLGVVAEARGDWTLAERHHSEALRLRREIADARGVLHSTHALGRVRLALGDRDAGVALFDEAEQLASDLDEPLERAKVTHTRAELALGDGDSGTAETLAAAAHEVFERCATRYDVTHTDLTLATAAQAGGRNREAVQRGAVARASIARHGYGLLGRLYPQTAFPYEDRIAAGLTAYACGDALGVPWEGRPPSDGTAEEIEALPTRGDWPRGATSDDTALTLLVAEHLVEHGGSVDPEAFLARLAERAPTIRGLGPSTLEAIRVFDETGRFPTAGGNTNGAPMRALPLGWATAFDDAARRRQLAIELSRATHPSAEAQVAACVMVACASWALEGAAGRLFVEIAIEEARAAADACGTSGGLADQLVMVSNGEWTPPAHGIGLDPYETVVATLACLQEAPSLREVLVRAVGLGGDTDTVAALTGGLLGCGESREEVLTELLWHSAVTLPPDDAIVDVSAALARLRAGGSPPSTR